jgi:hypothetical protein
MQMRIVVLLSLCGWMVGGCSTSAKSGPGQSTKGVPTLEEALAAQTDVWGDAAVAQPGGPSYEFFADLLPPLRYPDANFWHYPIALSAPQGTVKARLVSNGSTINALGRTRKWVSEVGTPVTFRVGQDMEVFGADLSKLKGPTYERGYLPIVHNEYEHAGATITQEVFASVDPELSKDNAVVFVRMGVKGTGREKQKLEVWFDGQFEIDQKGNVRTWDDKKLIAGSYEADKWDFAPARSVLSTFLAPGESVVLAIYTKDVEKPLVATMTPAIYESQRAAVEKRWDGLLADGLQIQVPEPVVNNAWRSMLIGNYMLINNDRMFYSAGNQYQGLYIGEGGDSTRCLALYGHAATARQVMPPLFRFTRKNLEYHQAGFKLQMLAHYYFLTRDAEFVRQMRPLWEKELNVILSGREQASGLFPPEKYAGDLPQKVPSLNSNSNAWRALRDLSIVLEDMSKHPATGPVTDFATRVDDAAMATPVAPRPSTAPATKATTGPLEPELAHLAARDASDGAPTGAAALRVYPTEFSKTSEHELAQRLASTATEYRKVILTALDKAIDHSKSPPYYPLDLSGNEKPYDPITATSPGSYWNIMIQYSLGSGVFPYNSKHADDLLGYLRTHGGVMMGMNRSNLNRPHWNVMGAAGVNQLYGLRRCIADIERDDIDRALVNFYGTLAQGFTRDTFLGGEGECMVPLDQWGRMVTLPPNSAANSNWLWQLRYMLVQDFDLNDDGPQDTLRLLFATPRKWLANGKTISVEHAPTAFGEVSVTAHSDLSAGQVIADVDLPQTPPAKVLLRLRLPEGNRIVSASSAGGAVKLIDADTLDLTGLQGKVHIVARTR